MMMMISDPRSARPDDIDKHQLVTMCHDSLLFGSKQRLKSCEQHGYIDSFIICLVVIINTVHSPNDSNFRHSVSWTVLGGSQ